MGNSIVSEAVEYTVNNSKNSKPSPSIMIYCSPEPEIYRSPCTTECPVAFAKYYYLDEDEYAPKIKSEIEGRFGCELKNLYVTDYWEDDKSYSGKKMAKYKLKYNGWDGGELWLLISETSVSLHYSSLSPSYTVWQI